MLHHESKAAAAFPYHTTYGTDPKAWAKRFVHRFENGDTTLLPVQIKFAQMALGLIDESQPKNPPQIGGAA